MIKVAINGFGRIGRLAVRELMQEPDKYDVVAINIRTNIPSNQLICSSMTLLKADSMEA